MPSFRVGDVLFFALNGSEPQRVVVAAVDTSKSVFHLGNSSQTGDLTGISISGRDTYQLIIQPTINGVHALKVLRRVIPDITNDTSFELVALIKKLTSNQISPKQVSEEVRRLTVNKNHSAEPSIEDVAEELANLLPFPREWPRASLPDSISIDALSLSAIAARNLYNLLLVVELPMGPNELVSALNEVIPEKSPLYSATNLLANQLSDLIAGREIRFPKSEPSLPPKDGLIQALFGESNQHVSLSSSPEQLQPLV